MSITAEQKQERTRLAAINEVIKTIASSLDLRHVYDTFASQLKRLVAFDHATVSLIEGDKVKVFALSADVESEFIPGMEIPLKGTAAEWIATHKKVHIATDLAKERKFWTEDTLLREGMRSAIRIPLFSKGEVIGMFSVASHEPNAFSKKEQQVLEEVALLLAVAIENARLFEQTRVRAEELEASEEKYRRLAEDINDGYLVTKEGKVVFANAKMAQILGYKLKELIGEDASKFTPPEFIPYAQKTRQRVKQGRRVRERLEGAILNRDGERVPVEISMKVVDYEGEPANAVIVRDITERKRAEEALQRYTRRVEAHHAVTQAVSQTLDLEQLMDVALDKVLEVMDLDGGLIHLMDTEAGEMVVKAHRGVPEEFVSALERMEVSEADIQRWLERRGPVFRLESIFDEATVAEMRTMTQEQWPESYLITPLWSKDVLRGAMALASRSKRWFSPEEVDLLQAIGNQIAIAIENAELFEQIGARAEELKASQAKYRRLAEDINDGYIVVTAGGKILFANAKMAHILGYKRKKLVGEEVGQFIPGEFTPYLEKTAQRLQRRREVIERLEGAFVKKDGDRVPVEMSFKPVDYEGEVALAVIVRDITERKQAEEEIKCYTKRVEALHTIAQTVSQTLDLEQMLDAALEKVIEVMEVDVADIYLMDEAAEEAILSAHKGISEEFVATMRSLKLNQQEIEEVLAWKEPTLAVEKLFDQPTLAKIRAAQEKEELRSSIIVPLWSKGVILGAMVGACRHPREFIPEDIELLQAIANEIAVGIENARLFAEVSHSAITDGLTGLYNHRHFQERLEEEVARIHRFGGECSLIMLDLDHFKIYNDLFGHVAGDEVLKRVSQVLRAHTREVDIACRYGGEEFTVILPQTASADAYKAAERLRQAVEQALSLEGTSTSANLTVSLGVASCPGDGLSREALIHSADLAMWEAKQRGRNQTCLASELAGTAPAEGEAASETTEHLEAASLNTIYALAAAVDARDHYTYGHSRNVSKHAVAIGKALGLSRRKLGRLRIAALLHDIGKIGLSDSIIRKPGPLDEKEWEMMKKHSELGATIISHTPELADCAPAIRHHHEWQDGSGYPDGLKGEDIPLEARIIAIADAYDTMTTPRAYRETLSPQEALEELRRCANTQFDSQLVEAFARVANAGVRVHSELSPR